MFNKYIKWNEIDNTSNKGLVHIIVDDEGNISWKILTMMKVTKITAIAFLYSDIFKEEYKKAIEEIKNERYFFNVFGFIDDEERTILNLKTLDKNKNVMEEKMILTIDKSDCIPTTWTMKIVDVFKIILKLSERIEKSNLESFKMLAMDTTQTFKFDDITSDLLNDIDNDSETLINSQDNNIEDLI